VLRLPYFAAKQPEVMNCFVFAAQAFGALFGFRLLLACMLAYLGYA
jgi:hypothetical protein